MNLIDGRHNPGRLTAEDRFWIKVAEGPDGCWLWGAGLFRNGYGQFQFGGSPVGAHRFAYESMIGPIPTGLVLDHLCRTPRCVNPWHLDPVTNAVNIFRGRGVAGINRSKTHCHKGHPLSGDNLIVRDRGRARGCRTCNNARRRELRAERRAA